VIEENERLTEALKAVLGKLETGFVVDEVEEYFADRLVTEYDRGFKLGEKIRKSPEGIRYYGDFVRERYFLRLLKMGSGKLACLDEVVRTYERGEYGQAAAVLE
jgi:hypothetical protein